MSLNHKEIDVVIKELDLTGSFIQQIVQPTYDSLALYTYKTSCSKVVLVCLAPGACRMHETKDSIPKSQKPLRFMEFLRSRVKGCRIDSVTQLGAERIVIFNLSRSQESFCMYLRLWSGAANIIVTDTTGLILDVFYRRPKRAEISGETYIPQVRTTSDKEWKVREFDQLPNSQSLSFNEKVALWYREHAESLSREALLEQAARLYEQRRSRMETALEKLVSKREGFLQAHRLKHFGDLILANAHMFGNITLSPSEKKDFFECEDYKTNSRISIEIDRTKTSLQNARKYYELYKKAISGLEDLEKDIEISRLALEKERLQYAELLQETNPLVIQQKIRRQNTPRQQLEKKHPGLAFTVDGWYLLVGRTAEENDQLLRRHVKGQDTWLHTRDWPGGYVFIKNRPGKTIPLEILLDAGNLAVFYSKGRKAQKADVYCTQVKYLRRAKNAPRGTVLPTQEKNLYIVMDDARLKRLESFQEQ